MSNRLAPYRKKRDFGITPEPSGKAAPYGVKRFPIFVIQEHAARRLHYDFRLEVERTLKSWAVPKGPPILPGDKRLAVRVEDHPMEYASFEGQIPIGEYGAGTVMVWDAGYYSNLMEKKAGKSMAECLEDGHIEIALKGKKLEGNYALIHSRVGGQEKNWLLIKMRSAETKSKKLSAVQMDRSVLTGRTLAQIERDENPAATRKRGRTTSAVSVSASAPRRTRRRGARRA
jgi:DNA ligase D-like protein (predicted 3'-phosphoesterase)